MRTNAKKVWISSCLVAVLAVAGFAAIGASRNPQSHADALTDISTVASYKTVMSATAHPFLVTNRSKIGVLRDNINTEPYKTFAAQAVKDCKDVNYVTSGTVEDQAKAISRIMGACSLMYIIDPNNNAVYLAKIEKGMTLWPNIRTQLDAQYGTINHWLLTVPTSTAFVNATLAYDVVYNQVTPANRTIYNANMQSIVDWFQADDRGFGTAQDAPPLIWHAFNRDAAKLPADLTKYHDDFFHWLSPDRDAYLTAKLPNGAKSGSFTEGPEYGLARLSGERTGKSNIFHILEFTGLDRRYYRDVRVKGLLEFLLGSAYGPNNVMVGFEDSGSGGRDFNTFRPQTIVYDAGRVSDDAAGYAAYRQQLGLNPQPPSDLFTYVMAVKPAAVKYPSTQVYPEGGFFAWETANHTKDALYAALWNTPHAGKQLPHTNYNTNSLFMIYGGMPILVNGGYAGAGASVGGFGPDYMKQRVFASNVVALDGENHWNRNGGQGLTEWTIGNGIDYASGRATGIFHADFDRNMVFVQAQDGVQPFVFVIDQLKKGIAGTTVNSYFHPAAKTITTTSANTTYQAPIYDIAGKKQSASTFLSIFFGKQGAAVTQRNGFTGAWSNSTELKYLEAQYKIDDNGNADAVTALFPSDASHPAGNFSQQKGIGYEGAAVQQGKYTDYAVTSDGTTSAQLGGFSFKASAVVSRRDTQTGKTIYYLARQGTTYDGGNAGFTASKPITIHMRGTSGEVFASEETALTFKHMAIKSVKIDGKATAVMTVSGATQVTVPAGLHTIITQ